MTRGEASGSWRYSVAAIGTTGVLAPGAFAATSDGPLLESVGVAALPVCIFLSVAAFGTRLANREPPRHVRLIAAAGVAAALGYALLVAWFYALVDHDHTLLASAKSFHLVYGTASLGLAFGVGSAHHYVRQRERSRELRAANEELRAQNERLDEFASIISHDLRNPLAVARGYVDLAKQTGDVDHLEDVQDCHERIEALVEQVLALARMERDPDAIGPVDVAGVATDALETVDVTDCEVTVDVDCTVQAERSDLQQVFENVYRNSVEHAGPAPELRVTSLDDAPGFAIEDDGPGIPSSERDAVFERGCSNADGTGLGLAIVAELAAVYEWAVTVTDGTTGGARFEFRTGETHTEPASAATVDERERDDPDRSVEDAAPR